MTRQKVKLQYISNESVRKATFKKRKKGIMKKVNELAILCGIETCAIIFNPFDSQPEVWPNPQGAQQVIERYQNATVTVTVTDESRNVNQKSFMMQRIARANEQLQKLRKENHEKELTLAMFQGLEGKSLPENLTIADLHYIKSLIVLNMKEIERKMSALP